MKYVITEYNQYTNPNRLDLVLEDVSSGQTMTLSVASPTWEPPQKANLHLELKGENRELANNSWASHVCLKCKKLVNSGSTGIFYSYHKQDRAVCNDCFAIALDRMLDLDRSAEIDKVLHEGDK